MTSTVPVSGIGDVKVNPQEATSQKLLNEYMTWMKEIQEIFNKKKWSTSDYNNLVKAMQHLKDLALHGDKTSPYGPYYMPKDMLGKLDTVFSMLESVGITPEGGLNPKDGLKAMQKLKDWVSDDGKNITFELVLTNAVGELTGAAKTLQSMLETEFVIKANGQYEKKLSSLEDQIKVSKDVIDWLADLQDYRNKRIIKPGTPTWNDSSGYSTWENGKWVWHPLTETGKTPIAPNIADIKKEDIQQLVQYVQTLSSLIKELKDRRISPSDPNYANSPPPEGSLEATLTQIRHDLNFLIPPPNLNDASKLEDAKGSIYNWLMDGNYQIGGDAGKFQDHIAKANNAALSLNESQKDELRSTQYNYEQFMKIATSLMDNLNKLIVRFAQGASK
jgi:hypothetical protein